MSDNDTNPTRTLKPLGVRRSVDAGEVKQTFSHGRTNKVAVEVKRRRKLSKPGAAGDEAVVDQTPAAAAAEAAPAAPVSANAPATPAPAPVAAKPVAAKPVAPKPAPQPVRRAPPSNETPQERVARMQREAEEGRLLVAEEARRREEAERVQAAEGEKRRAAENRRAEEAASAGTPEAPAAEAAAPVAVAKDVPAEAAKATVEAPAKASAPEAAAPVVASPVEAAVEEAPVVAPAPRRFTPVARPPKRVEKPVAKPVKAEKAAAPAKPAKAEKAERADTGTNNANTNNAGPSNAPSGAKKRDDRKSPSQPSGRGGDDRRRGGKLTVNRALNEDEGARARSLAALKRAREKERRSQMGGGRSKPRDKQVRDVVVPESIVVAELANRMAEKGADLVKALFNMGMMVTINQAIDQDTAELLVEEFGHNITRVAESDVDVEHGVDLDPEETLRPRPPVIAIMGHVDHGKTSLLDALRGTDVVKGEAGGITQHIGAYQVTTKNKHQLTVLDTPGHAAFTQMRARGANVTDIVILVVAADDGIMPQTIEAIKHTRAAGVPMIVAINKMDKPDANPQRVRERLLEHEIVVEAMSGDVQDVEVSAKTGQGLDELIEKIMNQAEMLELKSRPDRDAEATVIEAKLDKGRGPVATVLVTRGTLKRGDIFVVGSQSGRVRALVDDKGKQVKEAGPSTPVEVLGLSGVPGAGDQLTVVENDQRAREVSEYRQAQATAKRTASAPIDMDNLFANMNTSVIEFPVVVKGDVHGSVEAINAALNNLSNDEIKVRILHSGVGAITESDVNLASASKAPIIGFNVRPNTKARELVARHRVEMKYFDVIYHLTEEIAKEMAGELGPLKIEHVVGRAEVKQVFPAGKRDKAAGLLVLEGSIRKGLHARLTRQDVIVSATTIASLRRFKDDVDEVRAGMECGVVLSETNDIKAGDMLEVFEVEERERTL